MSDYDKLYKNSLGFHDIQGQRYKKPSKKDIWGKRISTAALIVGLATSAYMGHEGYNALKSHQTKVDLMHDATKEMIEVGYSAVPDQNGNWDSNYYLLKDIDLIKIYALMGDDGMENVLKAKGYENVEKFLANEGFETLREWRDAELKKEKESKKR